MSRPRPPLDDLDRAELAAALPWVGAARAVLVLAGLVYLVIGLVGGPLYGLYLGRVAEHTDDPEVLRLLGLAVAVGMVLVLGTLGALNLASARGLRRGRRWAWYTTLALGAVFLPSVCLPFGAVLIYAMLRVDVRTAYLS